jgi:PAS domain S-box-containing protein
MNPRYEQLHGAILGLNIPEEERSRLEGMVRDEIWRWRRLVEQSRDGIVILDQDGKVHEANKRFADMLGYTLEEVRELHVWDWDTQFTEEQLSEMIASVDETGAHFVTKQRRKDGVVLDVELSNNGSLYGGQKLIFCICRDVTDQKRTEMEREKLIDDLQKALLEIKTLKGILPLCSKCNRIMDEQGKWEHLERYIKRHSEARISHGLCPECARTLDAEQ